MGIESKDDIFLSAMAEGEKSKPSTRQAKNVQEGTVVAVTAEDVFLSMGGKSECIVPKTEFDVVPQVGEKVSVVIVEMKDGVLRASRKEAEKQDLQQKIKRSVQKGEPISGVIEDVVMKDGQPKGFIVMLGKVMKAFLPLSQIDVPADVKDLKGKTFDFLVIEQSKGQLVVSRRELLKRSQGRNLALFFEKHHVGDVVKGVVEKVEPSYLFIVIENVTAFMHISDFSWKYIKDLTQVVKVGDMLEVKILEMNQAKKSIKVGRKQLLPDPWQGLEKRYKVGDILKATAVSYKANGVLLEVEEGVEAFLSADEISWTEKVRDPKKAIRLGASLEVKIINLDMEKRRMDVSLREIQANPWDSAEENYTVGRKLEGTVSSVVDFGVFVRFDDGIEGLLRREDIDWIANVDPKTQFKKGDKVTVVVLQLDTEKQKLRLGMKQLSDHPYKAFQMNYPKGSAVRAKILAIQENGVEVEVDGLVGFIHISQLSTERIDTIADHFKQGDEIEAAVRLVDPSKNKIELSVRDLLEKKEKQEVSKHIASTEAGESPTIGSLLGEKLAAFQAETTTKKSSKKKAE
ncbi:MAG: S1 RNA-binding domain-containing protein [Brevinematales bacterium]|nr:S1 RNA-binding domain-containing protein [Brevinematales bacterium]